MAGNTITDGSLKPVAHMTGLSLLELDNTGLTTSGLADLRDARIASLELIGGAFDDGAIETIGSLPLKILVCGQCSISDEALATLKIAIPELQVIIPQ